MSKIVGIGEIVFDIIFRSGEVKSAVPGGSTFNAMVSLGRTAGLSHPDVPVMMISQLGDDAVGDMVMSFVASNHMDGSMMKRIPDTRTTLSVAMLNERNDARYEFFRDPAMPQFKADEIVFERGDLLLFGSFFALNEETSAETARLVRNAKEAGAIIYYDINFRKGHISELSKILPVIESNCALSDFVRGSSEDIFNIYGSTDALMVYREHLAHLCGNFICTKGAEVTEVFSGGELRARIKPRRIKTVSTIGAGDNFNAGFLYGLLREGYSKESVIDMKTSDWKKLLPVATKFSSNVCRSMFNYVDVEFINSISSPACTSR